MSGFSAPTPIVIDASALVELLLLSPRRDAIAAAVGDSQLLAPDLVNVEVMQCLRRLERAGKLTSARAGKALERMAEGALVRVPSTPLMGETWALRHNLSAYDACYVALARTLRCPLLSLDGPLTRAPRLGVTLIVV